MFRKFDPANDVSTSTQVKASVLRGLKSQLLTEHSLLTEEQLDELLPKKAPLVQYKVGPHLMLYCKRTEYPPEDGRTPTDTPVLFQHRDGPLLPTLKLVHKYDTTSLPWTQVTVDKGAIPYVLGGANIMCPGLTNPGGQLPDTEDDESDTVLPKGRGVVIFAQGKEHAIAVGSMAMSAQEIRTKNKGVGIELAHYLGDELYQCKEV